MPKPSVTATNTNQPLSQQATSSDESKKTTWNARAIVEKKTTEKLEYSTTEKLTMPKKSLFQRLIKKFSAPFHRLLFHEIQFLKLITHGFSIADSKYLINEFKGKYGKHQQEFREVVQHHIALKKRHKQMMLERPEVKIKYVDILCFKDRLQGSPDFSRKQIESILNKALNDENVSSDNDLHNYASKLKLYKEDQPKYIDALEKLGLNKNSPLNQEFIKKAYHKLALKYHTDKQTKNTPDANEKFMEIKDAYQFLIKNIKVLSDVINLE